MPALDEARQLTGVPQPGHRVDLVRDCGRTACRIQSVESLLRLAHEHVDPHELVLVVGAKKRILLHWLERESALALPDRFLLATKPSGSQLFYDTAGSRDKTLKLYEGHFHDLLNDLDKAEVMADIKGWIDARL